MGFAETPDGGITSSGRNGVFHGPGKCNCRGVVRSTDGGTTFGELTFDPVLVEPECMATMVNGARQKNTQKKQFNNVLTHNVLEDTDGVLPDPTSP